MKMRYPKLEVVETADVQLLEFWFNELPSPGENYAEFSEKEFLKKLREEAKILTKITERYLELTEKQRGPSLLRRAQKIYEQRKFEELTKK